MSKPYEFCGAHKNKVISFELWRCSTWATCTLLEGRYSNFKCIRTCLFWIECMEKIYMYVLLLEWTNGHLWLKFENDETFKDVYSLSYFARISSGFRLWHYTFMTSSCISHFVNVYENWYITIIMPTSDYEIISCEKFHKLLISNQYW